MVKTKSATRRVLIIIGLLAGLLVILGAAAYSFGWVGGGDGGPTVETAQAERRQLTQVVTASGKVQPEVEVNISPDVSGEITELPVREGQKVRKGDLLARIEADEYQARREQASANVLQQKANMQQAEADLLQVKQELERQKKLYEKEAISKSELQNAQAQYEVAKAQRDAAKYRLQSAQASLQQSTEQLQQTEIFAPMTGTVSRLNVEEGERVVGTRQRAGTELMRIALLDQMEMEVDVNENDVINVADGDTARIEIDALPDRSFLGEVTEIANSARVSGQGTQQQVTNFPVKVRIYADQTPPGSTSVGSGAGGGANTPQTGPRETTPAAPKIAALRPGMSGTADVFTQTEFNAVSVPIQAVTVRDFNEMQPGQDTTQAETSDSTQASKKNGAQQKRSGGEDLRKVVFLVKDGKARMRPVKTGIADDRYIQITSGLDGGETVITGPYRVVSRRLKPGMKVDAEEKGGGGGNGGSAQRASL
jgi:HlyD family secretion protein